MLSTVSTYPTRTFQDILVIRIIIALTADRNFTKLVLTIHVCFTFPLEIQTKQMKTYSENISIINLLITYLSPLSNKENKTSNINNNYVI